MLRSEDDVGRTRALFLDRDGTLNKDVGYAHRVADFAWEEGALDGLRLAASIDYEVIVVTNQAGVARGYYTEQDVRAFHEHVRELLSEAGLPMGEDQFYFCPHHPTKAVHPRYHLDCPCRKPRPGMLLQAAKDHGIDLSRSYMVGDAITDLEAGRRAGCRGQILIRRDPADEEERESGPPATYVARDLLDAVAYVLAQED